MPILTLYSWLVQENPLNMFDLICFVTDLQIFNGPFILTSSISEVSYMISTVDQFEWKPMLLLYGIGKGSISSNLFGCLTPSLFQYIFLLFSLLGKNAQTREMTKSMLIYSLSSFLVAAAYVHVLRSGLQNGIKMFKIWSPLGTLDLQLNYSVKHMLHLFIWLI